MSYDCKFVSPENKKAIAEDVSWETVEGLLSDERKEKYQGFLDERSRGTVGYIHAWILKLGGYLD